MYHDSIASATSPSLPVFDPDAILPDTGLWWMPDRNDDTFFEFYISLYDDQEDYEEEEPIHGIDSLPIEIFMEVLKASVANEVPMAVLMSVSKYWREVALLTPLLWTRLAVTADLCPVNVLLGTDILCRTPQRLERVFNLSRKLPLHLVVVIGSMWEEDASVEKRLQLFGVLKQQLYRVQSMRFHVHPRTNEDDLTRCIDVIAGSSPQEMEARIRDHNAAISGSKIADEQKTADEIKTEDKQHWLWEEGRLDIKSDTEFLAGIGVFFPTALQDLTIDCLSKFDISFALLMHRLTLVAEPTKLFMSASLAMLYIHRPISLSSLIMNLDITNGGMNISVLEHVPNLEELSCEELYLCGPPTYELKRLRTLDLMKASMVCLERIKAPSLKTLSIGIEAVCSSILPIPAKASIRFPELEKLDIHCSLPVISCIVAPKLKDMLLEITVPDISVVNTILSSTFDGSEFALQPEILTLFFHKRLRTVKWEGLSGLECVTNLSITIRSETSEHRFFPPDLPSFDIVFPNLDYLGLMDYLYLCDKKEDILARVEPKGISHVYYTSTF